MAYSADSSGPKIVYLGGLDYLLDDGDDILETVDGIEVSRSELSEGLSEYRDVDNVEDAALEDLLEARDIRNQDVRLTRANDNNLGGYISNVFTYAKNVYGGTWENYDWVNNWEKYAQYAITKHFDNNNGNHYYYHCGPTAITNIIKMYGNKYSESSISTASKYTVFTKVMEVNEEAGYRYYTCDGGTYDSTAGEFLRKSFQKFGVTISIYGRYKANYDNIKNASTGDRLMLIMLHGNGPYGNHSVVGFACNRIINQNGGLISFVKVAGGHNTSGRYIETLSISQDQYWEAYFS